MRARSLSFTCKTDTNLSTTCTLTWEGTDSTFPPTDLMWASNAFNLSVFSVLALNVSWAPCAAPI